MRNIIKFAMHKMLSPEIKIPFFTSANLKLLFEASWRLAIFALPWQTRWFVDLKLAGYAFEQGRISFYLSWFPLVLTVFLGFFISKQSLSRNLSRNLLIFIFLLAGISIVATPVSLTASAMWWLQIVLLSSFFIMLIRANVASGKILIWFIIALLPHAFFALYQFYMQIIPGFTWLGVAPQSPADLGVSVIQNSSIRFLRAYGGFPHPNILGGFMSFAIIIITGMLSLPLFLRGRWREFLFLILPIFTAVLFYSFSRSAWLALAAGLLFLQFTSLRSRTGKGECPEQPGVRPGEVVTSPNRMKWLPVFIILLTFSTLAIIHFDLTATRLGLNPEPARLEQVSNQARASSLKDGISIVKAYPVFGTGPNSELPALWQLNTSLNKRGASSLSRSGGIEPPHNVFILMLANFGVAGALIIFGFLLYILRLVLLNWPSNDLELRRLMVSCFAALLVISLFDHYPWSLWSGQYILIFSFYLIIAWLNGAELKFGQNNKLC